MLYLGKINGSQREAWCRVIEAFDEDAEEARAVPPEEDFRLTPYRRGRRVVG